MRCIFTSDLHGQPQLYAELVAWVSRQQVQAVILGGDMLCDASPAHWRRQLDYIRTRLRIWLERLRDAGAQTVGFLHGNHDWAGTDEALNELVGARLVQMLPDFGQLQFAGAAVLSYSFTPPSPFVIKDYEKQDGPQEVAFTSQFEGLAFNKSAGQPEPVVLRDFLATRSTIAQDLNGIPTPAAPWLFVCHGPPMASTADLLWLPPSTELQRSDKFASGVHKLQERLHVGSESIANFIARSQPTLSLHGHVHESPYLSGRYVKEIGKTKVINPGQRRDCLHAVIFETEDPANTLWHTIWGTRDGPASSGDILPPRPSFCM